jgi:GT2 family glycosyltransferase
LKVAVCIINYNSSKETHNLLLNLQKLTLQLNLSIFIVDNASQLSEVEYLKSIDSTLYTNIYYLPENIGFAAGNNYIIKRHLDEYDRFLLINNDTLVDIDSFPLFFEFSKKNENAIVGAMIVNMDDKKTIQTAGGTLNLYVMQNKLKLMDQSLSNNISEFSVVDYVSGACMLIPANIIKQIGYISEDYFLYYEETDYCFLARKNGFKILNYNKAIVYHENGLSTNKLGSIKNYYIIRNKILFNLRYGNILQKLVFFLVNTLNFIKWSVYNPKNKKILRQAILDGYKGVTKKFKEKR